MTATHVGAPGAVASHHYFDRDVGLMAVKLLPSEYYKRQFYSCFWFERAGLGSAIEILGAETVLFETDFPHPTCLYPDPLAKVTESLASVDREFRYKVLSGNATKVYSLPVPAPVD